MSRVDAGRRRFPGRGRGRRQEARASLSSSARRGPPRNTVGMSKRILVTGGAGFVGTHLVAHLVDRGDEVVVLDSLEPQVHLGHEPEFPEGVSFIHADVGDPVAADRALEGVDAVVHLAAAVGVGQSMYEIERYVRVNTFATATFL